MMLVRCCLASVVAILLIAFEAHAFVIESSAIIGHSSFAFRHVNTAKNNFRREVSSSPAAARKRSSMTQLEMNRGGGISRGTLLTLGGLVSVVLLVVPTFLPLMEQANVGAPATTSPVSTASEKQKVQQENSETNDRYRLSRSAIQEKLSSIPVFYLVDSDGNVMTDLYLSYVDAKEASASGDQIVKVTTLDQVEYPLILNRGRTRMAPPPIEIAKAEANLESTTTTVKYQLVPSKQAQMDAKQESMYLQTGNVPLFAADKLAFAAPGGGVQIPLFLEKRDVLTSYKRLSNKSLPSEPTIRSTTLNDELLSMEKGTRQGLSQLAFYATAEDINQAVSMMEGK